MKRILFMHHASTIGGGSYCLLNILKEIDKTYIQPVACLAGDGPLREEIEKLGIEVIIFRQMAAVPYNRTLCAISSLRSYYRVRKSINGFRKILADNKIDVVYLNNMMIYPYLKPAKENGCKTVLHCREHWPLNEHKTQLEWARNAVNNYCDKLIAINKYSASIFPDKEATIVYDWIDMESRSTGASIVDSVQEDLTDCQLYLFTGGNQRIKGAYEVMTTFTDVIVNPNARLLVLGYIPSDSNRNWKFRLKNFLYKIGFDINEIKCIEAINRDSRILCMPATYNITDIIRGSYCMLSYFNIPHANLALAECEIVGTPVIAAETDESIEYSLEGRLACLFKFRDINAFREAVINFDYMTYRRRLEMSGDQVRKIFSPETNICKLNSVLSELLYL